jgi:hypothetical protein
VVAASAITRGVRAVVVLLLRLRRVLLRVFGVRLVGRGRAGAAVAVVVVVLVVAVVGAVPLDADDRA